MVYHQTALVHTAMRCAHAGEARRRHLANRKIFVQGQNGRDIRYFDKPIPISTSVFAVEVKYRLPTKILKIPQVCSVLGEFYCSEVSYRKLIYRDSEDSEQFVLKFSTEMQRGLSDHGS